MTTQLGRAADDAFWIESGKGQNLSSGASFSKFSRSAPWQALLPNPLYQTVGDAGRTRAPHAPLSREQALLPNPLYKPPLRRSSPPRPSMDPAAMLGQLASAVKADPAMLHKPEMKPLKELIESFGGKVPDAPAHNHGHGHGHAE
eukprot:COSAG06_NODE_1300_length_9944_cov_248.353784_9_plen_145_part_00